ncbi:phosphoribosylamine--glycine ligase, partial [Candidatus Woesearchaeota archaeon CG_4_10_14_0_2_um_filter_33_10]
VMASGGYPGEYKTGKEISGLDSLEGLTDVYVFHAGTKIENGKTLTNGGRVLGVTGTGNKIEQAIDAAYSAVSKISFENKYYRTDIGAKALKR